MLVQTPIRTGSQNVESLDTHLADWMARTEAAGLRRSLREIQSRQGIRVTLDGRSLLNFSSNDYLGLAQHPALIEAAQRAAQDWGAGAGAARLVCGSLSVFHQLESAIAEWKQCPAALSFSTGFAAALGTVPALVGPGDVVILDKRVHACCVDAAKLSGAKLRVFRHNDPADLERILQWARKDPVPGNAPVRILIITESVFSMDGDEAPLASLVELKERYGAWLMVDEAHAVGLYGARRSGLAEQLGLTQRIEVHMGTLGKAVGASGGYIAGSVALRDHLLNQARSFVFSTAPVPAAAAAALAGIQLIQNSEGATRLERLQHHGDRLRGMISSNSGTTAGAPEPRSAILPVIAGPETTALEWSKRMRDDGFLVPAIRYPTVARGTARLRVTLSADHAESEVAALGQAIVGLGRTEPVEP